MNFAVIISSEHRPSALWHTTCLVVWLSRKTTLPSRFTQLILKDGQAQAVLQLQSKPTCNPSQPVPRVLCQLCLFQGAVRASCFLRHQEAGNLHPCHCPPHLQVAYSTRSHNITHQPPQTSRVIGPCPASCQEQQKNRKEAELEDNATSPID